MARTLTKQTAAEYSAEAFRAFERWVKEHDPDGNMDIAEQAITYSKWAETSSIEKYLDAAQPVNPATVS